VFSLLCYFDCFHNSICLYQDFKEKLKPYSGFHNWQYGDFSILMRVVIFLPCGTWIVVTICLNNHAQRDRDRERFLIKCGVMNAGRFNIWGAHRFKMLRMGVKWYLVTIIDMLFSRFWGVVETRILSIPLVLTDSYNFFAWQQWVFYFVRSLLEVVICAWVWFMVEDTNVQCFIFLDEDFWHHVQGP
jgi:hypothetical protein